MLKTLLGMAQKDDNKINDASHANGTSTAVQI